MGQVKELAEKRARRLAGDPDFQARLAALKAATYAARADEDEEQMHARMYARERLACRAAGRYDCDYD